MAVINEYAKNVEEVGPLEVPFWHFLGETKDPRKP
jgi:hypothetical protein